MTFAQAAIAYRAAEKPTRFLDKIEDHWRDTLLRDITAEGVRAAARKLFPSAKPATRNRQAIVPTMAIINYAADIAAQRARQMNAELPEDQRDLLKLKGMIP